MTPPKGVKVLIPSTCEHDIFGNRILADDLVQMSSVGWVLIHYDGCPYRKGGIWTDCHTWMEDEAQTLEEDHLQAKERLKPPAAKTEAGNRFSLVALKGNQSCQHLHFGLPASGTIR